MPADLLDTLQALAFLVGVGTPLASYIYWHGRLGQRLEIIEKLQREAVEQAQACRSAREHEERNLHDRVTTVATKVDYLRGRLNGKESGHA